eukprot:14882796-Alexandrium_andersonii.AAC.1
MLLRVNASSLADRAVHGVVGPTPSDVLRGRASFNEQRSYVVLAPPLLAAAAPAPPAPSAG